MDRQTDRQGRDVTASDSAAQVTHWRLRRQSCQPLTQNCEHRRRPQASENPLGVKNEFSVTPTEETTPPRVCPALYGWLVFLHVFPENWRSMTLKCGVSKAQSTHDLNLICFKRSPSLLILRGQILQGQRSSMRYELALVSCRHGDQQFNYRQNNWTIYNLFLLNQVIKKCHKKETSDMLSLPTTSFLAPTHVICVQQQQQLNVLSAGRFSVAPRLHCHNTETHENFLRPKQRPPATDVQDGHASFKPSVGSSCKGGSRGTAPLSSCSFVCVFSPLYPSTHGYHPVYALCGFFTPLSFALLTQRLLSTSCEASASLSSLSPLFLSLCQSLLELADTKVIGGHSELS